MNIAEIKALVRMLDRIDYYRLLKVGADSQLSEIKPAYRTARRRFHPDDYLSEGEEVRNAVDLISRRITEAYMVLRDRGQRAAYDRTLERGGTRFTAESAEDAKTRAGEHRGLTAKGRRFSALCDEDERRGDLAKAQLNLKMALTFEPKNEAFKKRLGLLQERMKK
ncbi:MAG: DnaJ domain-containing protein [bacterium]|nr:DnaJ domain-containing protein [bacterium]